VTQKYDTLFPSPKPYISPIPLYKNFRTPRGRLKKEYGGKRREGRGARGEGREERGGTTRIGE